MAAEQVGVHTVSIVERGFMALARSIEGALGARNMAVAEYPGVMSMDPDELFEDRIRNVVVDRVVQGAGAPAQAIDRGRQPDPKRVVFGGSLDDVQEHFHQNLWTDGLPIIPPTTERVQAFLRFTDRSPDEVLGVLLPEQREATVWNVAVNGVMAGCRPEYMPILIAIVEAMADPEFRIEDGGSTPSWEPLVILSGSLAKQLNFNFGQGIMKVGPQANTSVGRFARLYMRNGAGLRIPPGATDKGTIGHTFLTVLAEDDDAVRDLGWEPFRVDRGFQREDNVVTLMSVLGVSPPIFPRGNTALDQAQAIEEDFGRQMLQNVAYFMVRHGKMFNVVIITPPVAQAIARDRWTKEDVRQHFYDNVKLPASKIDRWPGSELRKQVEEGLIPKAFLQSDDPERLVSAILHPEDLGLVVAGDPARERMRAYAGHHRQGYRVSRKVDLPRDWDQLLDEKSKQTITR